MRRRIFPSILALLLLVSRAPAQTGDWQAVMDLAPGTLISVLSRYDTRCIFDGATDDTLSYELVSYASSWAGSKVRTLQRRGIYQVRIEVGHGTHAATGAVVGAGVGATIGAIGSYPGSYAKTALAFGIVGALVGGGFGGTIPSTRCRVIYKR